MRISGRPLSPAWIVALLAAVSVGATSPADAQQTKPYDLGVAIPAVPPVKSGDIVTIVVNVTNRDTTALPITPPDDPPINVGLFGNKSHFQIIGGAHWQTGGVVACIPGASQKHTKADCFVPDVNAVWPAGATRVIEVKVKIVAPPPPPGATTTIRFCAKHYVDSTVWFDKNSGGLSRDRHCRPIELIG